MKKVLLFGVLPVVVVFAAYELAVLWPVAPRIVNEPPPEYGIGGQQNRMKSGSIIYWSLVLKDDLYTFVTDYKRRPNHPLFLCYLNYTSTHGSYDPKWSKDEQMMAIYNESSEAGWGPPWIIGYDWKTGKVLQSKEILHAFAQHKGVGSSSTLKSLRNPTVEEIHQYKPARLHR